MLVRLSAKYQVVIPKEVRRKLGLRPKQSLVVLEKDGVVHLVPNISLGAMKGKFPGLTQEGLRDEGERE